MCFWILLTILIIIALSAVPTWPYSREWGYYPTGGIVALIVLLLLLWWMAWLPFWGRYPYWW